MLFKGRPLWVPDCEATQTGQKTRPYHEKGVELLSSQLPDRCRQLVEIDTALI
jgi:hypothetical protein